MERCSQDIWEAVLWQLSCHNGRMELKDLRRHMGIKLFEILPALAELEKAGRIRRKDLEPLNGHLRQVITLIR
jgi:DNA-binding HxlR family transcriptional regulator